MYRSEHCVRFTVCEPLAQMHFLLSALLLVAATTACTTQPHGMFRFLNFMLICCLELTPSSFYSTVATQGAKHALIQFYSPTCPYCQRFVQVFVHCPGLHFVCTVLWTAHTTCMCVCAVCSRISVWLKNYILLFWLRE